MPEKIMKHAKGWLNSPVLPILIAVLVGAFGLTLNPYTLFLLTRIVIFVMLIVGLNIMLGYSGQFTFAHAALFGVGAYTTGLLQVHLGLPFVPSIMLAVVLVTAAGTLLALPALRISGIHLAIATLAVAQAVTWVLVNWTDVTFGAGGFRAPSLRMFGMDKTQTIFVVSLVLTTAVYLLVRQLLTTSFGRRFIAIRDNQVAAAANGVHVTRVKAQAFAISAAIAGLSGGLYSSLLGFVAPESFNLEQMILMKIMVVVGGIGTMLGSVIGPIVVLTLQEWLRDREGWLEIIFGGMLVAFVLFLPRGLAPLILNAITGKFRSQSVDDAPQTGQSLNAAPSENRKDEEAV